MPVSDGHSSRLRAAARTLGLPLRDVYRRRVIEQLRRRVIEQQLSPMPADANTSLAKADVVVLRCSESVPQFAAQTHVAELAFAQELAGAGIRFETTSDASAIFDKSVVWFIPEYVEQFITPRLWDYSGQVREFAAGLERQGNRLFCSAGESEFWENKAHMHRELEAARAPTPATRLLTADSWREVEFDLEPVLLKLEHSAGSAGIRHFRTAAEARDFVSRYEFRPQETLIMQEVVAGATRDLRLTMVGDRVIRSTTYWRQKSPEAVAGPKWTTTATTYDSRVLHEDPSTDVARFGADLLQTLGLRTAGIDLIWPEDDLTRTPLILELSPYYQPNPPKPPRYADWSYGEYKRHWDWRHVGDNYLLRQHAAYKEIAASAIEQDLI